jgi:ADP-ribose pyrophosphatase YjhB (NUDIX family)
MKFTWEHYRYCPRCGTEYRTGALHAESVSLRCAQCAYEFFQNSSPAATAVVPSASRPREVILLTRTAPPGEGLLALPGGFLQYHEPPYQGVRREVLEEILLHVDVDRPLDAYLVDYAFRGALVSVLELVFLTKSVDYDVDAVRTGEATSVAYYDAVEFQRSPRGLAFPEQQRALQRYCDYLGLKEHAVHD